MTQVYADHLVTLLHGDVCDVLRTLPAASVHCVVTSPPYWGLRDYGIVGQIGLEESPEAYVQSMVEVFREVRRVLRDDGTLWLNLGDSYATNPPGNTSSNGGMSQGRRAYDGNGKGGRYVGTAGLKPKDLIGIPWRVALALQADGWWLRSEITWCKRAPMPESVTDRPTSATEKVFLLAKSATYYFDSEAVREPANREGVLVKAYGNGAKNLDGATAANDRRTAAGFGTHDTLVTGRNMRNWWLLGPEPYAAAHFATFPTEIPRRAILAGTSEKGCCAACGAPWVRVVESHSENNQRNERVHTVSANGFAEGSGHTPDSASERARHLDGKNYVHVRQATNAWRPTCDHDAAVVPCVVLDPFAGSCTTGFVAKQLNRRAIMIDLNVGYLALGIKRLSAVSIPMNLWS